ncbi:MAG: hypothetical protein AAFN43_10060 [Pseudomonadota bacterium]
MIAEAVIVMTLLGCGDEIRDCDYIASPAATYASVAECDAAAPKILATYASAAYPTITAECHARPTVQALTGHEVVVGSPVVDNAGEQTPQTVTVFDVLRANAEQTQFGPPQWLKEPFQRTGAWLQATNAKLSELVTGK